MGSMSILHWVVVLVVVLVIFGTKKLRNIGEDLGGAVRGFKEGIKGNEPPVPPATAEQPPQIPQQTIDAGVREKDKA